MIKTLTEKINPAELKQLCETSFISMVKFVADIKREMIAAGGELQADAEALLLQDGSQQDNLWGANLYPWNEPDQRIEYTSFINIRPRQGNNSMEISDPVIREKVKQLAEKLLLASNDNLA